LSQVEARVVRYFDEVVGAIQAEGLADFSGRKARVTHPDAVVRAGEVVEVPVTRPPSHEAAGRRLAYLKDETVDLVYLDPPFNSAQNYNAFFHEKDGTDAASQIRAFEDTWSWNQESQKVHEELILQPRKTSEVMQTSEFGDQL
jgi:16S rRNA G966 N2-methylase RsmD